jgi:hypothetical protein
MHVQVERVHAIAGDHGGVPVRDLALEVGEDAPTEPQGVRWRGAVGHAVISGRSNLIITGWAAYSPVEMYAR